MTDPRTAVNAAFAAYQATRGQPAAVQDAARRRYDATVAQHEAMCPTRGIVGTRDRMRGVTRNDGQPRRGSAWDPDPR